MFTFTSVQIYLFTNEKVVIFVKTSVMREKLLSLMRSEGLTSSRLAELLGIQPSGISHILSGRNKPSFDFVQKILRRFPTINPYWLLLDQGPMYRDTADSAAAANSPATQPIPQLFADTPHTDSRRTAHTGNAHGSRVSSDGRAEARQCETHNRIVRRPHL